MPRNVVTPVQKFITTIKANPFNDTKELLGELDHKNVRFSSTALSTIKNLNLLDESQVFSLYLLSPRDMGYEDSASYKDIVEAAKCYKYKLCPAIVGPYLASLYPSFLLEPCITIASDLTNLDQYTKVVFDVIRTKVGVMLVARNCDWDTSFASKHKFIFLR